MALLLPLFCPNWNSEMFFPMLSHRDPISPGLVPSRVRHTWDNNIGEDDDVRWKSVLLRCDGRITFDLPCFCTFCFCLSRFWPSRSSSERCGAVVYKVKKNSARDYLADRSPGLSRDMHDNGSTGPGSADVLSELNIIKSKGCNNNKKWRYTCCKRVSPPPLRAA